jgi:hypothetical protein
LTSKHTAFTKADLKRWRADMTNNQPGPMEKSPFLMVKTAISMTVGETPTGLILRIATKNGEVINLFANPAVVEAMAAALPTASKKAGWMDEKGRIIEPRLDH